MFITIDGPDGSGKSTAAALLEQGLSQKWKVLLTREPTDSPEGRRIREILSSGEGQESLTALFLKDRAAHLQDCIKPALTSGRLVVCDRYLYSTVCYQSLQGERVEALIQMHEGFLRPDIAFLLLPPSVELLTKRIGQRGSSRELFEREETLRQITERYRSLPRWMPEEPFRILDCTDSPEDLTNAMITEIEALS